MFAIVETSGRQYRIETGQTLTVDRVDAEVGAEITLDRVLLVSGDDLKVGTPTVEGAKATAKVIAHEMGEKLITYKYKPRKRTRVRKGFRASLTTLEITDIQA